MSAAHRDNQESTPKRRKIRRGTQSCWECKRRKTRCTFIAETPGTTCDGCRSRGTKCVGQEFPDIARPSTRADRLSRVEVIVESMMGAGSHEPAAVEATRDGAALDEGDIQKFPKRAPKSTTPSGTPSASASRHPHRSVPLTDLAADVNGLAEISHALFEIWPEEKDMELILSVPVDLSVLFHGIICLPYEKVFSSQATSSREMLRPPSRTSHPLIIARKLLLLAATLQGIPSNAAPRLSGMSVHYPVLMSRAVAAVSRLVTSNDDMLTSLEGIECVMMESMYLNNFGNLRRAWMTNRRAMLAAQMLGLHKGGSRSLLSHPGIVVAAETLSRIDPEYMWFRIVCSDRYLSLTLDLPQGSTESVFATAKALDGCMPTERMERIHAMASGLILQRNVAERTDLGATHRIDALVHEAAALMPPSWWLSGAAAAAAASPTDVLDEVQAFRRSVRLLHQLVHYNILVQLHLPYMLLPSTAHASHDYSKLAAASASRATLDLFVSFRNAESGSVYCRGIDFVAFVASTILCLAHIESRRQGRGFASSLDGGGVTAFQSIQHQRLGDRGLLERTLDIMETMAREDGDAVAQRISGILRPLLAIESKSAMGGKYHTTTSSEGEGAVPEDEASGSVNDAFSVLRIQIPHYGAVKIEQHPISQDCMASSQGHIDSSYGKQSSSGFQQPEATSFLVHDASVASREEDLDATWLTIPAYLNQLNAFPQVDTPNPSHSVADSENIMSGLGTGVDDWTLQGVDAALFSSLTYGQTDSLETA